MTNIHPSALIDPQAQIHETCTIGPFSVIGPHVILHENVVVKSHVVIEGHTEIGKNTQIFPFASIGGAPQDLKYHGEPSKLIIGENNTIREYVTMNPGTEDGGMKTVVGNNSLFMMSAHIAHDCHLGDHIVMANHATLAGHVTVGDHVWFGGLSAVLQFVRIGSYAVIGGMAGVENDVIPFGRVKGERGHLAGLNLVRMERMGLDKSEIKILQRAFNRLFSEDGTMDQRIDMIAEEFGNNSYVRQIVEFARTKDKYTLCQPKN
ncbi:MAG: acyl-ACP--UDP-N-acetylglucosamine O-acyltransferase [Rhodospirillales bacterium]|nr:acyl-ACP--UDP-N-acetylglucosamine O-acyltransferase [Rhodospirillales bacterium]